TVAVARKHQAAAARRLARAMGPVFPHACRAQPLMQEHKQGSLAAFGCDPPVFQAQAAAQRAQFRPGGRIGKQGGRHSEAASICRSRNRWILPVAVLGSSSVKLIWRGYLNGARCCFTYCCKAAPVSSLGV